MTFQTDVCEMFGCDTTKYYEVVLFKCMYPHAVLLAKIIRKISPGFFIDDYELLMKISKAETVDEITEILNDHYYERPPKGIIRGLLKVRISPERLIRFASQVMKKPFV